MKSGFGRSCIGWSSEGLIEPHAFGIMHLQVAFKLGEKTEFATLAFHVPGGIVSRAFHFFSRLDWMDQLLSDSEGRRLPAFGMYGFNVL